MLPLALAQPGESALRVPQPAVRVSVIGTAVMPSVGTALLVRMVAAVLTVVSWSGSTSERSWLALAVMGGSTLAMTVLCHRGLTTTTGRWLVPADLGAALLAVMVLGLGLPSAVYLMSVGVIAGVLADRMVGQGTECRVLERDRAVALRATEGERRRIALDLHDTVGKTLEGALLTLAALDARLPERGAGRQLVDQLAADLQGATSQTRMMMLELRSDETERLSEVLTAYARRWSSRTGVLVDLDVVDLRTVPPSVCHDVLTMATECLANVERHAGADRVTVRCSLSAPDCLTMLVHDDGVGFPASVSDLGNLTAHGRLGLSGMRERASRYGGRVQFSNDDGALVGIELPMCAAPNPPITQIPRARRSRQVQPSMGDAG